MSRRTRMRQERTKKASKKFSILLKRLQNLAMLQCFMTLKTSLRLALVSATQSRVYLKTLKYAQLEMRARVKKYVQSI